MVLSVKKQTYQNYTQSFTMQPLFTHAHIHTQRENVTANLTAEMLTTETSKVR